MHLPKMVKIRQKLSGPVITEIDQTIANQFITIELHKQISPGMRVAITAGSRGIANIPTIIRAVVNELKRLGASPFIVPAMGSHGGATSEGQVEVLKGLGITEEFCGAPIISSMEVVEIGTTPNGMAVHLDKRAWEADGIILMGRIKVHTDFKSQVGFESGLMKMAAIGLGKHKQALLLHSYGVHGIRDLMPDVARVVIKKAKILCGIAILENALEQTAKIEVLPTGMIERQESKLLKESEALMPKLPIEDLDILIVDEIGKNFSGTGMDTNIIGRMRIHGVEEPSAPRVKYIIASDLSDESHGNALGIGLADLTTQRLFNKIDFQKMNENVITSTFILRGMIPLVLENDREALHVALRSLWGIHPNDARIMRIPNTLHLEYLFVSEALLSEMQENTNVEILGEPMQISFDENGDYLDKFDKRIY